MLVLFVSRFQTHPTYCQGIRRRRKLRMQSAWWCFSSSIWRCPCALNIDLHLPVILLCWQISTLLVFAIC